MGNQAEVMNQSEAGPEVNWYLAILNSVLDALVLLDEGGTIIASNPAAERLFGYPAAEIIGRPIGLLIPNLRSGEQGGIGQFKAPIGIDHEHNGVRMDGFTFPLRMDLSDFLYDGKLFFVALVRDDTANKMAEEMQREVLDEAVEELEFREMVTQRWPQSRELELISRPVMTKRGRHLGRIYVFRDITHEREVDRMKTQFVSMVSHELRTPLTSIKGFTEMILDEDFGEINEEQREFLGIVEANADRLIALVNDLLDISRIVDDESMGINLIIVSNWARTGWNVIKPNVLIDATATRDVTAWQQLQGRAIRALRTWNNDCYRLILLLTGNRSLGFSEEDELPEDVARAFDEVSRVGEHKDQVDTRIQALLEEVASPALLERIGQNGIDSLSEDERYDLAIALMRHRNKVTHIYELLKAYGSTIQLIYDRPSRKWRRRDNIALKHENEISVQPFTGEKMTGAGHAPMLYAKDPRSDLPATLQERIQESIIGSDEIIVAGWMEN